MTKRAAIYVRVSSEKQAEKASPGAQEDDSREYCNSKGYTIVEVYKDTLRYRVGKKLVEPSGSRSDRPELKRMLADADKGLFDVIVAWREDRLYRGMNRATLEISERVKNKVVSVELVKEFYDPSTAIMKSWASGWELDAKRDRFFMGVASRLRDRKKIWSPTLPYGYMRDGEEVVINEDEAKWIRKMFEWRLQGLTFRLIRERLISNGAPQRKNIKIPWAKGEIREKLIYEPYSTGIFKVKWDGTTYDIPIPPLVTEEQAAGIKEINAKYKSYPSGNMRAKALAAGKVYCNHCNRLMSVVTAHYGNGIDYYYYACSIRTHTLTSPPGCARYIKMGKVDSFVWDRVEQFLSRPEILEEAILEKINILQAQEIDAQGEVDRLLVELERIRFERHKVISWARMGRISEDELDFQLSTLEENTKELQIELAEKRMIAENRSGRLLELAELFRAQVMDGWEIATKEPESQEEIELQFKLRKKMIEVLVSRVDISGDKTINITGEDIKLEDNLCIGEPSSCFWRPVRP